MLDSAVTLACGALAWRSFLLLSVLCWRARLDPQVSAAAEGKLEEVKRLASSDDIHVNAGDYDLRTALHLASSNGHIHIVRYLVQEKNADPDVRDRYDNSPMVDAVRHKQDDVVRFLRESGASLHIGNVGGMMCSAAANNDAQGLRRLVEGNADVNACDYDSRTAMHLAASNGCHEAIQYLLSCPGINVMCEDRVKGTPLMDAIRHKHRTAQEMLRAAGGKLSNSGLEAQMCEAAGNNDLDTLQTMQSNGADMNAGDDHFRTPLHIAASRGRVDATSWLASLPGIDVNAVDIDGFTPLDDAVVHKHAIVQVGSCPNACVCVCSVRDVGQCLPLRDACVSFISGKHARKRTEILRESCNLRPHRVEKFAKMSGFGCASLKWTTSCEWVCVQLRACAVRCAGAAGAARRGAIGPPHAGRQTRVLPAKAGCQAGAPLRGARAPRGAGFRRAAAADGCGGYPSGVRGGLGRSAREPGDVHRHAALHHADCAAGRAGR